MFTWTEPPPYAVTLLPPAGGNTVSDKVTVVGQVAPAPATGTPVLLRVNDIAVAPAHTDANGNFTQSVSLVAGAALSDLTLTNPGRSLVECGTATSGIFLRNGKNPLALINTIVASIGGSKSNALNLTNAVKVKKVHVSWTSAKCPGPPEDLAAGQLVAGLESKNLGTVHCGISCSIGSFQCEATVRVDIETSVGSTYTEAPWDVNIE